MAQHFCWGSRMANLSLVIARSLSQECWGSSGPVLWHPEKIPQVHIHSLAGFAGACCMPFLTLWLDWIDHTTTFQLVIMQWRRNYHRWGLVETECASKKKDRVGVPCQPWSPWDKLVVPCRHILGINLLVLIFVSAATSAAYVVNSALREPGCPLQACAGLSRFSNIGIQVYVSIPSQLMNSSTMSSHHACLRQIGALSPA